MNVQLSPDEFYLRLRADCFRLRTELEKARQVAPGEIQLAWESGDTAESDVMALARRDAALRRVAARAGSESSRAHEEAIRRADLLFAALSDQPAEVHTGSPSSPADNTLLIYPKSIETLRYYVGVIENFKTGNRPKIDIRIAAWIATSPGPGLPFPAGNVSPFDIPQWLVGISNETLQAIVEVFSHVNFARIELCQFGTSSARPFEPERFEPLERGIAAFCRRIGPLHGLTGEDVQARKTLASQVALSILANDLVTEPPSFGLGGLVA